MGLMIAVGAIGSERQGNAGILSSQPHLLEPMTVSVSRSPAIPSALMLVDCTPAAARPASGAPGAD